MAAHWNLFSDRVLQPIVEDAEAPSLEEVCLKHGIEDKIKASNMIFTVKKRFQAALRRLLRQSVASDTDIKEEILEIMRFFTKCRQDPK